MAALLGMEDAPADDREELFAAWRRFFERIADHGDHRRSSSRTSIVPIRRSWTSSRSCSTGSRAKPILVIGLARPELLERRPTWGSMGRASVALHLEPFARDGITELLEGLVPGLPQTAVSAIAERAEGVPLFAVETVRMLLDDGRMVRDGGQVRLTDPNAPIAVPPSLHALIAARLDALSADGSGRCSRTLGAGQDLQHRRSLGCGGRDPADVEERLRAPQRKDLVTLDSDRAVP